MKFALVTLAISVVYLASVADGHAQTQPSAPFGFARHVGALMASDPIEEGSYNQDMMFITKSTTVGGKDYALVTFGDTLRANSTFWGNTIGWSDDFDLSDGTTYHYKEAFPHFPAMGMTPMSSLPHDPGDPDATETQIWFSRSFVLGQDIYSYYTSFAPGHVRLGVGLAVIRGGMTDADFATNHIAEFQRIPKANFWLPLWFDGAPIIKAESDGNTYLYLFNQFGLQRVLFTADAVEHFSAYQSWDGANWVYGGGASEMWPSTDFALRASCEWNPYLNKWLSVYAVYDSADGLNSQLAYRTADDLRGPWSDRKIFYYGTTRVNGGNEKAGDYYSPVYRAFYDQDGGQTIHVVASHSGSSGPVGIYEYKFDHTVATRNVGSIPQFAPQGLDETVNVNINGASVFYFRDTGRYGTLGNLIKTYPNSYLSTRTDFDASNGLTFDGKLRFNELRTIKSLEGQAWVTAAFPLGSFGSAVGYIGAFDRTFDRTGADLGTGVAYGRASAFGHLRRVPGVLPAGGLASKVYQVVSPAPVTVLLNDENDSSGNVYLAKANTTGTTSPFTMATALANAANYSYSTLVPDGNGFDVRSWSTTPSDAVPLFADALKPSIFQNDYTGGWIAIYTVKSSLTGASSQVAMRTAQTVYGPWSDPVVIYSASNGSQAKGRLFDAKYLNGFDRENGKVVYFYASDFETNTVNLFELRLDN